jgi:hypothetical protein
MSCEQTGQFAAELALGIADGAERARALDHLADCAECRRAVADLSEVVDDLLLLAPEHEPPVRLESRVLAQVASPARHVRRARWRRPVLVLAPAAAAAALAVGVVLAVSADDRRLADQYRSTLAAANGRSFQAAPLRAPADVRAGVVYGYRGAPSWIFVAVDRPYRSRTYGVELALASGERHRLPALRIDPTSGTGGQAIPMDLDRVASVRLVGTTPGDVLEARLKYPTG